jgi:adenylate cyclase
MFLYFLKKLRNQALKDFGIPAKKITASVLVTNMTGYVGIAEKMPLAVLSEFMNQYFETHCSVIEKFNGCIDQFAGDRIVAFWGMKNTQHQNAQLACESAVSQMTEMEKFYAWAKDKGYPCPKIRIGISTGPAVIGNLGSKTRFNYTVLGACVTIAQALEEEAKKVDSGILVDENTRNLTTRLLFGDKIEVLKGASRISAFPLIKRQNPP